MDLGMMLEVEKSDINHTSNESLSSMDGMQQMEILPVPKDNYTIFIQPCSRCEQLLLQSSTPFDAR